MEVNPRICIAENDIISSYARIPSCLLEISDVYREKLIIKKIHFG